jgi:hypothetical protein
MPLGRFRIEDVVVENLIVWLTWIRVRLMFCTDDYS